MLPHLLVPELRDALEATPARRLVALNLAAQAGETDGFSPEAHLEVLAAHAPELQLDVVLADERRGACDRRGLHGCGRGGRRLGSCWPPWPSATAHRGTTPGRLAEAYAPGHAARSSDDHEHGMHDTQRHGQEAPTWR